MEIVIGLSLNLIIWEIVGGNLCVHFVSFMNDIDAVVIWAEAYHVKYASDRGYWPQWGQDG